jgi:hypothetical protein
MIKRSLLAAIILAAAGCLPSTDDGAQTRQLPSGTPNVLDVSYANGKYTVRSEKPTLAPTELRALALPDMRHVSVAAGALKAGKHLNVPVAADAPLAFVFTFGAGPGQACRSPAAGLPLVGKVDVACGPE